MTRQHKVSYNDIVQIDHPEVIGTGIVKAFLNDDQNGVKIEIIKASRVTDGKPAKPGAKFNCKQEYLTTIDRIETAPLETVHDDIMSELFKSEEAREEAIGVVTPEFNGRWR